MSCLDRQVISTAMPQDLYNDAVNSDAGSAWAAITQALQRELEKVNHLHAAPWAKVRLFNR